MSARAHLAGLPLRAWLAASDDERDVTLDALLEVLPPDFRLATDTGHERGPLPLVIHAPTQLGFLLFFGERFELGPSDAERAAADELVARLEAADDEHVAGVDAASFHPGLDAWDAERIARAAQLARPRRIVDAAPFLLAERVLDMPWRVAVGLPPGKDAAAFHEGARERLRALGWRLPSEAELELARHVEALPGVWGRWSLASGWCADAFDEPGPPPADARPWGSTADVWVDLDGRRRLERGKTRAEVRPALDLFEARVGYGHAAVRARGGGPAWVGGGYELRR